MKIKYVLKKKLKISLILLTSFIIISLITYKLTYYIPPFLDVGKRNFPEKTIDFLCFGWHITRASIFEDYLKNKVNANQEFGKAGWYRKKYLGKKFKFDEENLVSVLDTFKKLKINSFLEKLYIFFMRGEKNGRSFLREAGEIFMTCKNWKMAIRVFSKRIETNPYDVMGYYYLGLSYMNIKKLNDASQCFEKAIELKPNFSDAYFQLGLIEEKKKNWEKAKSLYEKTLFRLPNHLAGLEALERIYENLE